MVVNANLLDSVIGGNADGEGGRGGVGGPGSSPDSII